MADTGTHGLRRSSLPAQGTGTRGRPQARQGRGRPVSGGRGDRRPGTEVRRPGAALREREGLRDAPRDERLRDRPPAAEGPGAEVVRRHLREDRRTAAARAAARLRRRARGLREARRDDARTAEEGEGDAPVQEVVLTATTWTSTQLPALFTWPQDGGSFFNLGLTHTKDPESGIRNLGLYRLQRHDRRTIGMHWQIHKDSRNHYQVAARQGRAAAGRDRLRMSARGDVRLHRARCPATSTSTSSPGSSPASASRWSTARPFRCRCRPRRRS